MELALLTTWNLLEGGTGSQRAFEGHIPCDASGAVGRFPILTVHDDVDVDDRLAT
jgi:hypothetical protein